MDFLDKGGYNNYVSILFVRTYLAASDWMVLLGYCHDFHSSDIPSRPSMGASVCLRGDASALISSFVGRPDDCVGPIHQPSEPGNCEVCSER